MNTPQIVRDSELDYESDLVCTLDGKAFTGIAFDESRELGRSEVSYREGVQEGPARDWYPSGVLKGESYYVQGVIHGTTRGFDEGGNLVVEIHYEYGIRVRTRRFASDGSVVATAVLDPDDEATRLLKRLRVEYGWP